ncbi:class I SAM-dependent methyltransferase [Bradyrhizobium erythrophlei]|uniref:Methyltransferase domain-containing protein n=1 Tax=Bradyrhizobium erythrophlei TaxID=1437360 RepID=A0A1M7T634_9BRAD|nr:methyltransferase domain-containing protein [Bradyrhizobium erythrophlei]SHN66200.1 Methyltransferase domain-containing protein [Bradyrhizobium erythrophlei]
MQALDRVTSSYAEPILDAPCGFGRNALALASLGYDVIAVDNNVDRLKSVKASGALQSSGSGSIVTLCADLASDRLPFRKSSFSAILCIHYPVQKIIMDLCAALDEGGWLYIETFGGQGQNYLELPKLGEIPEALQGFELVLCKERPVGPPSYRAAVVQALAQKRPGDRPV